MSDVAQIIIVLFGSSGIFYIIVKEWLAYNRRRQDRKAKSEDFDEKLKNDSATFILDFGKEKIRQLEESYAALLKEFQQLRNDIEIVEQKYNQAIQRIGDLEKSNIQLKKELDECLGANTENGKLK